MTASTPVSAATSTSPVSGSHCTSSGAVGTRRTSRSTSCPSPRSDGISAVPSRPEAPVIATFTERADWSQGEVCLERAFFEPLLDRRQEAGGIGAVDDAVVVGQREEAHRAHGDRLAEVGVVDHDRSLDDGAGAEDRDLRLVDDRGVEERAATTRVGDRERAATELIRSDLVGAGALGEVGDLAGQPGDVEVSRVADDRDEKAALGVDGDAEVLRVVVGDLALVYVDAGVELRVRLQRLDGGLGEERQERELGAL